MGAAGLNPHDDDKPAVRVSKERLAEFDCLMAQGGISAVIDKLDEVERCRSTGRSA